jgi:transposase
MRILKCDFPASWLTVRMEEREAAVLENLSDDPVVLKRVISELAARVQQLEHQLGLLRRTHFGATSERFSTPDQLSLFGKPATFPAELPPTPPAKPKEPSSGHGRAPLPPHLKRIVRTIDVSPDKKRCPDCGKERTRIGADTAEQIEYTPATLVVIRTERPKYACRGCQEGVVVAEPPPAPIEKGLPGPGMLAYVAVAKYDDHLPLYRQQEIFRRQGVEIARSTLCGWVAATSELLEPVVDAMMRDLLGSKVVQTDDIPVPVQESPHTREGRLWVYLGDRDHPHIVYRYSPNRQQQWAQEHLRDYHGHIQADAYTGYDKLYEDPGRIEVGCWAHARRKFFDAQGSDAVRSATALQYIRELYLVEDEAMDLSAENRRRARQERSKPVLEALRAWMTAEELSILPKSPMGEAFTYARNQWAALNRYVEDGDLAIDNNASERALRGVAVGRKNWLFAGSDDGGRRAATLYSLIESAKRTGVEPWAYLRELLVRIDTHSASRIAELMPCRWKPTV